MATGQFIEADPDLISQVIWAGLHGLTTLLIVKPSFPWCDRDRLIELTVETLVRIAPSHPEPLAGTKFVLADGVGAFDRDRENRAVCAIVEDKRNET